MSASSRQSQALPYSSSPGPSPGLPQNRNSTGICQMNGLEGTPGNVENLAQRENTILVSVWPLTPGRRPPLFRAQFACLASEREYLLFVKSLSFSAKSVYLTIIVFPRKPWSHLQLCLHQTFHSKGLSPFLSSRPVSPPTRASTFPPGTFP